MAAKRVASPMLVMVGTLPQALKKTHTQPGRRPAVRQPVKVYPDDPYSMPLLNEAELVDPVKTAW